ncbi:MAG: hypothetical protein GEU71_06340 [Actinobacteria bacterium]|nr:hypothetical protein [Actinomycetota bacterium]
MGEKGAEGMAARSASLGGRSITELSRDESVDYLGTLLGWGKERVADTFGDYSKDQLVRAIEGYLAGSLSVDEIEKAAGEGQEEEPGAGS